MSQPINGRTPESIKNTQDVCILSHDCNGKQCPYYHQLGCVDASVKDALDLITKLEAERDTALNKQPRWICVKDQDVPAENGTYLCTGYWIGSGRKQTETADYFGEWKIANNFVLTHWMALPKLPEEDDA